ncbi:YicC family protein [bacterium]|nr:YicC family protein [bacterium]MBU1637170.1 YicC family protein [bacterium]MBU1919264.1 YicC family protein [bacterium]
MIQSMTGFGRGEASRDGITITAELRTLNNRFFDFGLRAPRGLLNFESEMRELCRKNIERGKVSLILSEHRSGELFTGSRIDAEAAKRIADDLSKLSQELGLNERVNLSHLLYFPDVVTPTDSPEITELQLQLCREATEAATVDLSRMRATEGKNLMHDMLSRTAEIQTTLGEVIKLQAGLPTRAFDKLKERVKRMTKPEAFDEYRLEMELALIADRLDITEECVRLEGHIGAFNKTLDHPTGQVGKRLGFLLQEMNREANTISSKTSSIEISHLCVRIREEIERLREQVQNLE